MKTTSLNIKKPCSENWNEMSITEKGRFCELCKKDVIDFTNYSSREIAEVLKSAKDEVCGKAFLNQLQAPIFDLDTRKNWELLNVNKAAGLLIAASLIGSQAVISQTNETLELAKTTQQSNWQKTQLNSTAASGNQIDIKKEEIIFSGEILNSDSKVAVINAKIIFVTKERLYMTNSDSKGNFTLQLPKDIVKEKNVVVFEFDDITPHEKKIDTTENRQFSWPEMYVAEQIILTDAQIKSKFSLQAVKYLPMLGGFAHSTKKQPDPLVYINGIEANFKKYIQHRYPKNGEPHVNPVSEKTFTFSGEKADILYGQKTKKILILVYSQ